MSGTNWGPFRMVQAGGEYATVLAKACSTANVRGFRNLDPDQRREVLEKLADEAEQLVNDLATLGKAKPPAPDVRKGRIRSVEDMTFEERQAIFGTSNLADIIAKANRQERWGPPLSRGAAGAPGFLSQAQRRAGASCYTRVPRGPGFAALGNLTKLWGLPGFKLGQPNPIEDEHVIRAELERIKREKAEAEKKGAG